MTRMIIAYILVVPIVPFCLTAGVYLGGLPISFLLLWAPMSLRTKISSVCGGIVGVALAIACGYGIFRLLVGPESFTLGPFLASSIPLLIPISNDIAHARRCTASLENARPCLAKSYADGIAPGPWGMVTGEIAGFLLAIVWYFQLITF